jgi:hypothetical protein
MIQSTIPQRFRDWAPIRQEFVDSVERPTYTQLAEKHGIPINTVTKVASDEGWMIMRHRRLETLAEKDDALSVIRRAVVGENALQEKFRELVIVLLGDTLQELSALAENKSQGGRLNKRQTISFTILNCAAALKAAGITGLPAKLRESLEPGAALNGEPWRSGMIQNINVLIKNAGPETTCAVVSEAQDKPS